MKKLQQLLLPHIHQLLESETKAQAPETPKAKVLLYNNESPYNTPNNRFQRKRTDVFRFRVYAFIPCGVFVGRMQYAPTRVRV